MESIINRSAAWCALLCLLVSAIGVRAQQATTELFAKNETVSEKSESVRNKPLVASVGINIFDSAA